MKIQPRRGCAPPETSTIQKLSWHHSTSWNASTWEYPQHSHIENPLTPLGNRGFVAPESPFPQQPPGGVKRFSNLPFPTKFLPTTLPLLLTSYRTAKMSATINDYIFNAPENKIRELLAVMCNNDYYVHNCTRHWINALHQEERLRAQEAQMAAAAGAPCYYGYHIANNNNINGTYGPSLGWSSSTATTTHNGGSMHMQNRNQVTVNGNPISISNFPGPHQPMKRKTTDERPVPPSPKRMAVATERRQQEGPVIPEVKLERESTPEPERESTPEVYLEHPERQPAPPRKVRIKTESPEPTPMTAAVPVPSPPAPPRRKARARKEPAVITYGVRVCEICEGRYRESGIRKTCRHHAGIPRYISVPTLPDLFL